MKNKDNAKETAAKSRRAGSREGSRTALRATAVIVVVVLIASAYVLWTSRHTGSSATAAAQITSTVPVLSTSTVTVPPKPPSGAQGATPLTPGGVQTASWTNGSAIGLLASNYSKPCNLSGVEQITMTFAARPGYSGVYKFAGSNVVQSILTTPGNSPQVYNYSSAANATLLTSTDLETSLVGGLVCAGSQGTLPTPLSLLQLAQEYNGIPNGTWFTAAPNGSVAYFSVGSVSENGIAALALQERHPNAENNYTFINQTVILNQTRSLSSATMLYIPGANPMTSVSLASLIRNYSDYTPVGLATGVARSGQNPVMNFSYQFG